MFRTPYNQPLKQNQINMLHQRARKNTKEGAEARAELIARNREITKKANSALSRLEKSGYKRWAYTRAINFTDTEYGTTRFTSSNKYLADIDDIALNLSYASKFLNYDTRTISGQKHVDKEVLNTFRGKGIVIPKDQEDAFLDFISSDDFQTLKQSYRGSGDFIIDLVTMTTQESLTFDFNEFADKINELINNTNMKYDEVLEKFGVKI